MQAEYAGEYVFCLHEGATFFPHIHTPVYHYSYLNLNLYPISLVYNYTNIPTLIQAADADRDGMVSGDEFNKMIDMATGAQKRYTFSFHFP